MRYHYPSDTFGIVRQDYERPYPNPIEVVAGAIVKPVLDGSVSTDFMGWTWCEADDGRCGWVPDSWCERDDAGWRLTRDFNAVELSVFKGMRVRLIYSESGFVMVETEEGEPGWVPDAILDIAGDSIDRTAKR